MTLAGTRPPTVDEWDKYELHHRARLATKPGLTGMWQVSGRSNITDQSYKERVLELVSNGKIRERDYLYLWNLINKLIDNYELQKAYDDRIKKFVNTCNKYLIDKYFDYNQSTLNLDIILNEEYLEDKKRIIRLTQLSSGEKQIISLFSKLYLAWIHTFKNSLFFRKLFCIVFFTVMILFRTLLNRNMWMNPLSDVMGGWWIWEKQSDGTVTLTTDCFENIALMLPFTFLLMWTAKEKLLKEKGRQICFTSILWYSTKVAFLFSLMIEFLQLFLRLGTFQLSDLCYNTLGGAMGGVLYWMGWKVKK